MDCSQGHQVPQDASFCPQCGEAVIERCPKGHKLEPDAKFCHQCGVAAEVPEVDDLADDEPLPSFLQTIASRLGSKQTSILLIVCGALVTIGSFLPWVSASMTGTGASSYTGTPFNYFTAALGVFVIVEALRALNDEAMPRWVWYGAGGIGAFVLLIIGWTATANRETSGLPDYLVHVAPAFGSIILGIAAVVVVLTATLALLTENRQARVRLRKTSEQVSSSFKNLRTRSK